MRLQRTTGHTLAPTVILMLGLDVLSAPSQSMVVVLVSFHLWHSMGSLPMTSLKVLYHQCILFAFFRNKLYVFFLLGWWLGFMLTVTRYHLQTLIQAPAASLSLTIATSTILEKYENWLKRKLVCFTILLSISLNPCSLGCHLLYLFFFFWFHYRAPEGTEPYVARTPT